MLIQFGKSQYTKTHGHPPTGRGRWRFRVRLRSRVDGQVKYEEFKARGNQTVTEPGAMLGSGHTD